jgi:hypothetical protein
MRSARVFISCGQRGDREKKIGLAIEQHFADAGFSTYFAERVHSSDGLTENIFRFLDQSEYFVFVDFRRDRLETDGHRGSLFVNQELAIATFLKLPGIGFFETGVRREGIADYQIYNAIEFEDGTEILSALKRETSDWDPKSVNELAISYDASATSRGITITNQAGRPKSDWYHLEIQNRSARKHALACMAYITRITDRVSAHAFPLPTVELNWSAIADVTANIIAGSRRDLDAFFVVYGDPSIRFHHRSLGTTNPRYSLPPLKPGLYRLEYTVISTNFATVVAEYDLEFDGPADSVRFRAAEDM